MTFSSGDIAWTLGATGLVFLMTPALALFYGGMVHIRAVLNMLMMCAGCLAVVIPIWVLYGFRLSFGDSFSEPLAHVSNGTALHIPVAAFGLFQMMFAVITPAIIAGSIVGRTKFCAWIVFVAVWTTTVYLPVAYAVFNAHGWLASWGVIDFAGGTAVHVNSGAAGLAAALVIGKRAAHHDAQPHNLPMTLAGAGLLWFGWYGFNAGSALAADGTATVAFLNTTAATAVAMLAWMAVDYVRERHTSVVGASSGAVAGLVAITPSCASVSVYGAMIAGLIVGACCSLAVGIKHRLNYDDTLDVGAVHLLGGAIGSVLIGILANSAAPTGVDGLLYGGGWTLLGKQAVAVAVVSCFSFAATWLISQAIKHSIGFRIAEHHERIGIDRILHRERAYGIQQ